MDFVRPAANSSQFEQDDDMEWGMSEPDDEELVPTDPGFSLVCHPSSSACVAPPAEARAFWLEGGWDEGNV